MTRTVKRGQGKKRNPGWFKKGHDARRSTYRFTAQDCRVGWLVANIKHPHLRDWLKMRVRIFYWERSKNHVQTEADGRAAAGSSGGEPPW